MKSPAPGIYTIPADEYFAVDAASNSGLKLIAKSPAHFLYSREHPDDGNTADRDFRRALHSAVLTPDMFDSEFVVLPDDAPSRPSSRQREAKKPSSSTLAAIDFWDDLTKRTAGKTIIKSEVREQILRMQAAIFAHPTAGSLFTGGAGEQSVFWVDDETGADCRSRLDYLGDDYIADLKSGIADPNGFAMTVAKLRYHCQNAMYEDGTRAVGRQVNAFYFVAVEDDPPYGVAVYTLDAPSIEEGRRLYRRDLATYAWCKTMNSWPGYPTESREISLPRWAFGKDEE